VNDAALDYTIEHARRIRDWPMLEQAVDKKIEEQRKFVAWWAANVRGKGERANSRVRGYFVSQAEDETGMPRCSGRGATGNPNHSPGSRRML
jgi:hypothetical protein